MKIKAVWWIGVVAWLAYCAIIFATWAVVGTDYTDLVGRTVIVERLLFPEVLGAAFMVAALSWLGWWRTVMRDPVRAGPRWTLWPLLFFIAGFIAVHLIATDWSQITPIHLALLALSAALVGFNEEALTRGLVVVAWRGSTGREVWIWLASTALFALMHLPNGLFGIGLAGGVTQVVFTFLLGSGLYLLRRVSGTLLLPMAVHALWDFSTFSSQVPDGGTPLLATLFQFLSYFVALIAVIVLLWHQRNAPIAGPA